LAKRLSEVEALQSSLGIAGFIDVETTGLSPYNDEIVELCIVLFAYDRDSGQVMGIVDEYTGLREPSCPIPQAASRIHGITKRQVKGMQLDDQKIISMIEKADYLVAHNAKFDSGFVCKIFKIADLKQWYCSMNGIDWKGHGFSSKGLQNLLRDHNIDATQAHRAEDDVKNAILLLSQYGDNGEPYLKQLIKKATKRRVKKNDSQTSTIKPEKAVKKTPEPLIHKKTTGFTRKQIGWIAVIASIILISFVNNLN
jgi:DNA polymerase-3 subunit epsilon